MSINTIARLGRFEAVFLSPVRYEERRTRFMASLEKDGGFLNDCGVRWHVASDWRERFAPQSHWFRRVRRKRHYWAATCDHLDIMERALAAGVDSLLVLEDDATFIPEFGQAFWYCVERLPWGWRALQLNWNDAAAGDWHGPLQGPAGAGSGMMANLWSREGLVRFYDHALAHRERIIDACYDGLRQMEPDGFLRPSGQLLTQDCIGRGQGKDC